MAFDAKVTLEGKDYDALKCGFEVQRDVDQKGRPSSHAYGVRIWGEIESTEDTTLLESICSEYKPINGSLIFKKGDEDAKMKELEFEEGYVIKFKEEFERKDKSPMAIAFTISAKIIKCGNAVHEEEWPK